MPDIIPGAADALPKSLAELEEESNRPIGSTNTNNRAQPTPEELAAEAKAAEDKAAAEKAKAEADADAAGTKTAEELAADAAASEEGEEEVTPEAFYDAVNKLHGFEDFKVEYPEGTDPLSPEGLHIREKVIMAKAQQELDAFYKASDPRAYAYMLHRQAGGSDEDFMANKTVTLPDYTTFKDNVDLQKQVYLNSLVNKGVDEDSAKMLVEKAITDQKLFERSDAAYRAADAAEKQALAQAEHNSAQRVKFEQDAIKNMVDTIEDIVTGSKVDNIVIPDAKKADFAQFVKDHLFFDGEGFYLTKPLTKETVAKEIQAAYFGFVGGNLKDVVERAVKTEQANKFRLGASKTKTGPKAGTQNGGNRDYVALGDL